MTTPTTPPSGGLAAPNPIIPPVASIDINVQPSTAGVAGADLKKRASAHLYHFTKKVSWKGESYLLSIDFPCKDWQNLNADALKCAADEYAAIFLADLQEQLDNQTSPEEEQIKPGDDIAIHFQGEKGYVVYTQSGFDTHTDPSSKKKQMQATRETSCALSKIINDTITDTDNYSASLHQSLQSDTFKNLRAKAIDNKPVNVEPLQLKHQENNCFLNAAFQLLVNDPVLHDDLRNQDNYTQSGKDELYQAITAYDRHKSKSTPFELPEFGLVTGDHEDAVLGALDVLTKERFWEETIPSFLPDPAKFEEGKTLSLEAIAKEQNKELPNAFNIYVSRATDTGKAKDKVAGINDKGTLSLTKEGTTKAYELTSFMLHIGDDINQGHYVTYLRKGDQCWKLDDLSKVQSIDLKTFLSKAADGSYFRFCEEKTTNTMAASTTPAKEPNKVLEVIGNIPTNGFTISVEKGSMANAEGYLLVHPSTTDINRLHPQFTEICPNLAQEIKTENSWNNVWGLRKISYESAHEGLFGQRVAADIVQGTTSSTIHVPLNNDIFAAPHDDAEQKLISGWIEDTLNYAQEHGHTKLALPIPYGSGPDVKAVYQESAMTNAIQIYLRHQSNKFRGGLDVKIIYPKDWDIERARTSLAALIASSAPPPPAAPVTTFR